MKMRNAFRRLGRLGLLATLLLLRCGGGSSADGGGNGDGGLSDAPDCKRDADCVPSLPATLPANCAEAICDPVQKKCRYVAKDKDGDGHPTNTCSAGGGKSIEIGDDCDDSDPDSHPDAWDGPSGDGEPDHCGDEIDQDCSGSPDDGVLQDGTTCVCSPGDVLRCSQNSGGMPVTFPMGEPTGACRYGAQTCLESGKWGPCTDTVGPATEICNGLDDDCDGEIDDSAVGIATWYLDADGDGHGDKSTAGVVACYPPSDLWKKDIVADDCNDTDADTHPAAWDGPESTVANYGIVLPGFQADFYACTDAATCDSNPFGGGIQGTRVDHAIDFNFGYGAPVNSFTITDYWAVRWSGTLRTEQAGNYTFYVTADDGFRLIIDGVTLMDAWVPQPPTEYAISLDLEATDMPIVFEMYERTVTATARLHWEGPGFVRQPLRIVADPLEGDQPDRCGDGKDNDCNNNVDDGQVHDGPLLRTCSSCPPGTARSCGSSNVGECHPGAQYCKPTGDWDDVCAGTVSPKDELCNLLDDNCDGLKDNKMPPCACQPGETASCGDCDDGLQTCDSGGNWGPCVGASQRLEYCRDRDKDDYCTSSCKLACAADVDDTWKLKVGGCLSGTDCKDTDGQMRPGLQEVCDSKDNNCNGAVDENLLGASCVVKAGTPCQANGNLECVNGSYSVCNATEKPPQYEACDNIDNDCDGKVDDGLYLGNANYPEAACFQCATTGSPAAYLNVPLAGDADFGTNGPKVYGRVRFSNDSGDLMIESCALMLGTNGDSTVGRKCLTGRRTVTRNGEPVYVTKVITNDVTGGFSWKTETGYRYLYTDDDLYDYSQNMSQFDDEGTLTINNGSLPKIDWRCRGQMPGDDISYSNMCGCGFGVLDCVTVRYAPP